MLNTVRRISFLAVIIFLMLFNIISLYRFYKINTTYGSILSGTHKIVEIKKIFTAIEKELWGIISVYDAEKSKKVKFNEGRQYILLREIKENVQSARKSVVSEDSELQLEILQRTISSLARNIDFLKGQLALQEFDLENTEIFFKDSVTGSTLKDSYVDEMESLMEKVKIIGNIIDKNINSYVEKEVMAMNELNKKAARAQKKWVIINGIAIFIIPFVLIGMLLIRI